MAGRATVLRCPPGKGSLNAFDARAGYPLKRDVDLLCRSNPPSCVSGIPGTVGSGTRSLWQELAPLLRGQRDFRVWPFEGTLDAAFGDGGIALAELYPALAYAAALLPHLPGHFLNVSKTKRDTRDLALNALLTANWRQHEQVTIEDLDLAYRSEDHFDALLGAAALLRQCLRRAPLDDSDRDDPVAEGGILLTGAIDFRQPARTLGKVLGKPALRSATDAASPPSVTRLSCPIPGCTKVFAHGRSGWDGHVGSRRLHPDWYPELEDAEARRTQFRRTFADWFR